MNNSSKTPGMLMFGNQSKVTQNGADTKVDLSAGHEPPENRIVLNSHLGEFFDFLCTKHDIIEHSFWEIDHSRAESRTIEISQSKLYDFLHWMGLAKVNIGGDFQFVIQRHRVFRRMMLPEIIDLVNQFLKDVGRHYEFLPVVENDQVPIKLLREKLTRGSTTYFSNSRLQNLPTIPFTTLRDSPRSAYFPFLNGFVEVKKDGWNLLPYRNLTGDVWNTQIIEHEIDLTATIDEVDMGVFGQFLANVSGEKYGSLCSYLGFLLHSFRDPSRPQVVVLYDAKNPHKLEDFDSAQGGTGKGIIAKALSKLRRQVPIDGKSFSQRSGFPWQRLEHDTQLVAFQDVKKDFNFSELHSVVTDGISVNKKHRQEFYIPYEESPKFLITNNFIIDTKDVSDRRRVKEIELRQYYTADKNPEDDFGHLLFIDWDKEEWNKFYMLMIECTRQYLDVGFIDPTPSESNALRKYIQRHGREVHEVLRGCQVGERYFPSDYLESLSMGGRKFHEALLDYCSLEPDKPLSLEYDRSNGKTYFELHESSKKFHLRFSAEEIP